MNKKKFILVVWIMILMLSLCSCNKKMLEKFKDEDTTIDETICFFDNAKFKMFTDEKLEKFKLEEESNISFIFRGSIESGDILVKVYSEDNETIFVTSDSKYNESFEKTLPAGDYYYLLKMDKCSEGEVYNKAVIMEE